MLRSANGSGARGPRASSGCSALFGAFRSSSRTPRSANEPRVGQLGRRPAAANTSVGQLGRRPAAANTSVGQLGRRPAAANKNVSRYARGALGTVIGRACTPGAPGKTRTTIASARREPPQKLSIRRVRQNPRSVSSRRADTDRSPSTGARINQVRSCSNETRLRSPSLLPCET